MDCERFDKITVDLLYHELDEFVQASAERHMDHCSRCQHIGSQLRATVKAAKLPLVSPPMELAESILEAEREFYSELPWKQRVGRAISVLALYAMRPQLAMGALLLLMLGSSLLLLRARPGDSDRVHVTERGVPGHESESVAIVRLPEPPNSGGAQLAHGVQDSPAPEPKSSDGLAADSATRVENEEKPAVDAGPEGEAGSASDPQTLYLLAMADYRKGHYVEAQQRFDKVAKSGSDQAASAMLYAAKAEQSSSGCAAAAPRFEAVYETYSGTGIGHDAAWHAATCYRALGQFERAKKTYEALLETQLYAAKAQAALGRLENPRGQTRASPSSKAQEKSPGSATASGRAR